MPHFQRNKAAAKIQEADWRKLVRIAARVAEYVPQRCTYCGVLMTMATPETVNVLTNESKDHITPKSKGGTIVVPCCVGCNRDKHHLTIDEWRAVLAVRYRTIPVFYFERIALRNAALKMVYILSRLLCI